jgi:hypothetical protein
MNDRARSVKRKLKRIGIVLIVLIAAGAWFGWYKFFREEPQPDWVMADPDTRFKYGSLGGENEAGLPYWIWFVLPRMFPERLPGPGGYASLGVAWEEGREMPVGFTRKVVGFARVSNNCAVCHAALWRGKADETPTIVAAGPGGTMDVQGYFQFLADVAADPRFNADNVMREIELVYDLSWIDRMIHRFILIPIVKKRLAEQGEGFAWMHRENMPPWGRGRDDPMNLTKYFMLELEEDGSYGAADMPSIWNLKKYVPEKGMTMNWDGATHDARSVIVDSALGIIVKPQDDFEQQMDWLEGYLKNLPPPAYPFAINRELAQQGRAVFEATCARCHESERTGTRIALEEVGTDDNRLKSWNKQAAIQANQVVSDMGVERTGMVEEDLDGYIAVHLDGIWLRAPYLHNGSVPSLRDLLRPAAARPAVFWRGYDVYDQVDMGFVSSDDAARQVGSPQDASLRGNGNQGHEFGTELPEADKDALIEYLKTL